MKEVIDVKNLSKGGPYSHAIMNNGLIFISGQSGQNDFNKNVFKEQFNEAINRIQIILEKAGSSLKNVLKVTIYLSNKDFFSEVNELFKNYFPEEPPARTTVVTSFVDEDILIEIDTIAGK